MHVCQHVTARRARSFLTAVALGGVALVALPGVAAAATTPMFGAAATKTSSPGPLSDRASLNGSGPSAPTGTITFVLYGPNDATCARSPIFSSVLGITGNGLYSSGWYTASAPGTYSWVAVYSGDANYNSVATMCGESANTVVIGGTGAPALNAAPTSIAPAGVLSVSWSGIQSPTTTDWVALYAVGAPDSAIRAWHYTNGAASGSTTLTVPWGTPSGSYEVRLFYNNSMVRMASSNAITVG